jgi:integrase
VRTVLQVLRICGPESERRQGLGLIPRVPFVGNGLRESTPQRPVPTVDALRSACRLADEAVWPPQCPQGVWWRCWIGFGFVTGLRLTDMLTIRRSALSGDVVRWTAHKTGVEHVFVLPPWLLEWMRELPQDGELLFPSRRLPCFVRRELRRVSLAAEIPKLTPHGVRRACITEWSILSDDCGKIIHGEGLGIRSKYVQHERKLRAHLDRLPDLSRNDPH